MRAQESQRGRSMTIKVSARARDWFGAVVDFSNGSIADIGRDHSMTSSARSRIDAGTARLSALAVLRFRTISNFVGNYTGRSAGFSPRRMRST